VKRFLLKADRVVEKVGDWAMVLSGILILVIGLITTYGVGKRYIFHNPDPYTYELSIIFLVACILLALPGIQWQRRNLRVDWILTHFSQKWQNIIGEIFTNILAAIFVSVVIWKSWGLFLYSFTNVEKSQSAWQEPLWPMKLVIPIVMGWLWLTLISQLAHGVIHLVKGTIRDDTRIQLGDVKSAQLDNTTAQLDDTAVQSEDPKLQL
jgi:TRAP-type mannitol/chloroaromatic compound transport system permease small subunit